MPELRPSPCHSPVVNPPCVCGAFFDGCDHPSIKLWSRPNRTIWVVVVTNVEVRFLDGDASVGN
jgi:hypothetical protein